MARTSATNNSYRFFIGLTVVGLIFADIVRRQYLDYYGLLELSPIVLTPKIARPAATTSRPITAPLQTRPSVTPPTNRLPLEVPFTSQAPLAIWDPLHEEACEEASLLMVYYYRTGQKFGSTQSADNEIKKFVAWQESNGYEVSVTVSQLATIARDYLGLNGGRVIVAPTLSQLKSELVAGRPVIVPAAGRLLLNPNFTAPGPIYHMLVIKGYDENGFIVNDPGTRRGESYRYSFDRIMTAMHDWNSSDITQGQQAVLVFD